MLDASFNGIELMLIMVALLGATFAVYCNRRAARERAAEERGFANRDRDPLDETFRGPLAFKLDSPVYNQEK